jgi:hypothetical protein
MHADLISYRFRSHLFAPPKLLPATLSGVGFVSSDLDLLQFPVLSALSISSTIASPHYHDPEIHTVEPQTGFV